MLMAAAVLVADDISIVAVPVIAILAVVDISMDSIAKVVFGSVDVWLMVGWLRMCWSSEFLLM